MLSEAYFGMAFGLPLLSLDSGRWPVLGLNPKGWLSFRIGKLNPERVWLCALDHSAEGFVQEGSRFFGISSSILHTSLRFPLGFVIEFIAFF